MARLRLPEDRRQAFLDQALGQALRRPEILREAESAGVPATELGATIRERAEGVWATVQDEEAQLADVLAEQEAPSSSAVPTVGLRGSSGKAPLADRVARVERILVSALVDKGLLPLLRDEINTRLDQSFDLVLRIKDAPGLAEMTSEAFEVTTSAEQEVIQLISQMPAASIGVAGPRGAGKTTLIRRFVQGRALDDGQPLISVLVSAPVDYEPREFILHLFEQLTDEVAGPPLDVERDRIRGLEIGRLASAVFWAGVAAVLAGTAVLVAKAVSWSPHVDRGWVIGGLLVLLGSGAASGAMLILWRRLRVRSAFESRSLVGESGLRARAEQLRRQIKFQQTFTHSWSGSLRLPAGLEFGGETSRTLAERQLSFPDIVELFQGFVRELSTSYRVVIGIDEMDKIDAEEDAHRFLNDIKAVFGIDRCFYLVSISEDAMSSFERRGLPFRDAFDSAFDEVVHVSFLTLDDTRRFLERRVIGLSVPFVCLCHCASGGLARDVIRVAREIAANATRPEGERDAATVCRSLIRSELSRKCDAVSMAARSIAVEPELGDFVRWIKSLKALPLAAPSLLAHCDCAHYPSSLQRDGREVPDARADRSRLISLAAELRGYAYFAASVLDFFDETLTRASLEETQISLDTNKRIEALAEARQLFAMNTGVAWERVSEFRHAWGRTTLKVDFDSHANSSIDGIS